VNDGSVESVSPFVVDWRLSLYRSGWEFVKVRLAGGEENDGLRRVFIRRWSRVKSGLVLGNRF
jgi:hypothetical protein